MLIKYCPDVVYYPNFVLIVIARNQVGPLLQRGPEDGRRAAKTRQPARAK